MDAIEKAKLLIKLPEKKTGAAHSANVTTIYGMATSDSENGMVSVDLGGDTISEDGEQAIEVPTTVDVREGDVVKVELAGADGTGKDITITGVVGGGDRTKEEVAGAVTEARTKTTAFYQDTEPPSDGRLVNDIWFDTGNDNKMYFWDGSAWKEAEFGSDAIQDASIVSAKIKDAAITDAKIAELSANKITSGSFSATDSEGNQAFNIDADKKELAWNLKYSKMNTDGTLDFDYPLDDPASIDGGFRVIEMTSRIHHNRNDTDEFVYSTSYGADGLEAYFKDNQYNADQNFQGDPVNVPAEATAGFSYNGMGMTYSSYSDSGNKEYSIGMNNGDGSTSIAHDILLSNRTWTKDDESDSTITASIELDIDDVEDKPTITLSKNEVDNIVLDGSSGEITAAGHSFFGEDLTATYKTQLGPNATTGQVGNYFSIIRIGQLIIASINVRMKKTTTDRLGIAVVPKAKYTVCGALSFLGGNQVRCVIEAGSKVLMTDGNSPNEGWVDGQIVYVTSE